MINRSSVIVRPKKPFIDWVHSLNGPKITEDVINLDRTVYLIPEFESDKDAMDVLAEGFEVIFEAELYDWHTDPAGWPKDRSFSTFKKWFHIEFYGIVHDLCGYPISEED